MSRPRTPRSPGEALRQATKVAPLARRRRLPPHERGRLTRRFVLQMTPAMIAANVFGALVVFVYLTAVIDPTGGGEQRLLVNMIVFAGYLLLAVVLGIVGSLVLLRRLLRWFRRAHEVTERDRRLLLRLPARVVQLYGSLWAIGVVVFASVNAPAGPSAAFTIGGTILMGALTTCALVYLAAERIVRPLVVEVMHGEREPPPVVLGVRRRILLSWALGTAVPLTGIIVRTLDSGGEAELLTGPVLFLSSLGLLVGLLAMIGTARSISDPLASVTAALDAVGRGDREAYVDVYDVSEVGQLQSGFNRMVDGLRERDRLHDLFGRQVGTDVARLALERGVQLGGERREVAVLFVDVVGSTGLALEHEPEEVVRRLNAFFTVVVDTVTECGGWVNKFEGDAALCIFGAPVEREDAGTCALVAARTLAERLVPLPLDAAVGVCAGTVVAGHVGTESRFEYTVIGDPVNAAARLTDLAKTVPARVLADGALLDDAGDEAERWVLDGEAVLRGRDAPTPLAHPRP